MITAAQDIPNTDDNEAAFLAAVQAATSAQAANSGEEAPEVPSDDAADATKTQTPATTPDSTPNSTQLPAEAPPPVLGSQLLKLMEREAAIVERETKAREAEKNANRLIQLQEDLKKAQDRFSIDPASYIKKLFPDAKLADIAKDLWYAELGDAAPPEYQLKKTATTAKTEIEKLREELALERQNNRLEAEYNQYMGKIAEVIKQPAETMPLVKALAQANPQNAQRALLKVAQNYADQNNNAVLEPIQCAEILQKELEEFQKLFAPALSAPTAHPASIPPVVTAPTATPNTLRNNHTKFQPNRGSASDLDEEALHEVALKAAMAHLKAAASFE